MQYFMYFIYLIINHVTYSCGLSRVLTHIRRWGGAQGGAPLCKRLLQGWSPGVGSPLYWVLVKKRINNSSISYVTHKQFTVTSIISIKSVPGIHISPIFWYVNDSTEIHSRFLQHPEGFRTRRYPYSSDTLRQSHQI